VNLLNDISSRDGRGVDSVWVGDSDFRVYDAFEVVVRVVGPELILFDGAAIFIGQIAQILSFADVEAELERLALEAELLEGVRATVGTLLMADSLVSDVVVVSDVVTLDSVVAWDRR